MKPKMANKYIWNNVIIIIIMVVSILFLGGKEKRRWNEMNMIMLYEDNCLGTCFVVVIVIALWWLWWLLIQFFKVNPKKKILGFFLFCFSVTVSLLYPDLLHFNTHKKNGIQFHLMLFVMFLTCFEGKNRTKNTKEKHVFLHHHHQFD